MAKASVMVCNSVAFEVGTNNLVLGGAFDGFSSSVFPVRSTFYVVAKLWDVKGSSGVNCVLKLVDAESGAVVAEAAGHKLNPAERYVHTAISRFDNITIPKSGTYEARAYIGNEVAGAYPLRVGNFK